MKGRRAARRLAVDALYEAEIRDRLPIETFDAQQGGGRVVPTGDDRTEAGELEGKISADASTYARSLVLGVQEHHAAIDALITRYADRWTIERMPVIDRTLLRMALFEMLWGQDVPIAVSINEAVELAKALSTEDSGRFINGLLGRIVKEHEPLAPSTE